MSDLSDLYHEIILEHGKKPRNHREIAGASHSAEGFNPLCGDRVHVYIFMAANGSSDIDDISFTGDACAICTASASLMTEALHGVTRDDALTQFDSFLAMLTGDAPGNVDALERLAALAGVRRYPMRVKCATLPWHTMKAAIESRDEPVSTE